MLPFLLVNKNNAFIFAYNPYHLSQLYRLLLRLFYKALISQYPHYGLDTVDPNPRMSHFFSGSSDNGQYPKRFFMGLDSYLQDWQIDWILSNTSMMPLPCLVFPRHVFHKKRIDGWHFNLMFFLPQLRGINIPNKDVSIPDPGVLAFWKFSHWLISAANRD